MSNRYRLIITLLLTTLLAGGNAHAAVVVKGNVYGGGNEANVGDSSKVTISGAGVIGDITYTGSDQTYLSNHGNVFGGGNNADVLTNTSVTISGGTVLNNVYGGGKMGSVGTPTDTIIHNPEEKPDHALYNFALSWPVEFTYTANTGKTTVNISDTARIKGDVYGAGKGKAHGVADLSTEASKWGYRYEEALIANVRETEVNINYTATPNVSDTATAKCIVGSVYGGGEDGHVYDSTHVNINGGLIGGSVYGGGKGFGDYEGVILKDDVDENENVITTEVSKDHIANWLAGKVYGNTTVVMNGGHVVMNVYGGGNLGSVGKGSYSGGTDDYSVTGYGELPPKDGENESALWTEDGPFMTSGLATVIINTGTVGTSYGVENLDETHQFPTGNVFGSSRGKASIDVGRKSPRYKYAPEFFLGYVNQTIVTIGDDTHDRPTIYGSVYGGGQDGHVRRGTKVTINKGQIGVDYDDTKITSPSVWKEIGNVLGAGSGLGLNVDNKYNTSSGSVTCTTEVDIYDDDNTIIYGNVYGGGALASVGPPALPAYPFGLGFYELDDTDTDYDRPAGSTPVPYDFTAFNSHKSMSYTKVNIHGGVIGSDDFGGNVYGASRGADDLEKLNLYPESAYSTDIWSNVNISGGTINGNVFGGGEAGEVLQDAKVSITDGNIILSAFGGGNVAGVNRNTEVSISNGTIATANIGGIGVYGGCNTSGTVEGDASVILTGGTVGSGSCNDITGAITYTSKANVHGGGYGHQTYVKGDVAVQIGEIDQTTAGAVIWGDVYGGSAEGHVNAEKPASGTIPTTFNTSATTTVSLYNGMINGDAYGGGLGTSDHPAMVGGDVFVKLNGDGTSTRTGKKGAVVNSIFGANNLYGTPKGAITVNVYATQNRFKETVNKKFVLDTINVANISDSKIDTLRVILSEKIRIAEALSISVTTDQKNLVTDGTASAIKTAITSLTTSINGKTQDSDPNKDDNIATINKIRYDVQAVYGGGNLSEYYPTNADSTTSASLLLAARTNVLIDGCDLTSINQVYGGGNAASVAGAHVNISGTYEINEVFGGGNGNDPYQLDGKWYENPGANVGFQNYTEKGSQSGETLDTAIKQTDKSNASTPAERTANYGYGSGEARTEIYGGLIHAVYGGSNQRGNIRTTAISIYDDLDDDCPVVVDETYGGGKNAPMDGSIQLNLDCVKNMPMIFGGAKNADIYSDIVLNITNGSFNKVFGGNNMGGAIYGSITVNVEEKGCQPIYIDELYGGGYFAPYSIYGYQYDEGNLIPLEEEVDTTYMNPLINIISATQINNVYGGGYEATMVGSPHVNINMKAGKITNVGNEFTTGQKTAKKADNTTDYNYTVTSIETVEEKKNAILAIGSIGNVYGGGYKAKVVGDTYVEIGTGQWLNGDSIITVNAAGETLTYKQNTPGDTWSWYKGNTVQENNPTPARSYAHITGSVYGGGNQAEVTGNTHVNIRDNDNVTLPDTSIVLIGENIFGGGKGLLTDVETAKVTANTYITLGQDSVYVKKSIYGGGELAQVGGNTNITINGGTIGTVGLGGATWGNIYGGGFGATTDKLFGRIMGNTNVTINGGTILHNIYGGGAYGSVGTFSYDGEMPSGLSTANTGTANVTITGGTIGTDGHENGMVFGSSRGDVAKPTGEPAVDPNDKLAWVYDANVIIGTSSETPDLTTPIIKGSVYGSGENGHTYHDTDVKVHSGTIGINSSDNVTIKDLEDPSVTVYEGKAYNYPNRGNVYGGGCGTDTYINDDNVDSYNPLAGIVYGATNITIDGGHIIHNIYGAGALGSVGITDNDGAITSGGTTTIAISGGTVGVEGSEGGNVFGAARGDANAPVGLAQVKTTGVNISNGTVYGSVYGGGELGDVGTYSTSIDGTNIYPKGSGICVVTVTGGEIYRNVFGAGKGEANTFTCQKAMADSTNVTISNGTVHGNVYGGGEVGRVERNSIVTIGDGDETSDATSAPEIWGNVFGAGAGLETHGYSALVRGNAQVIVQDYAIVRQSVFGGGEIASVGRYGLDNNKMPSTLISGGECKVTVKGNAKIGTTAGDVFGAGKGVDPHFDKTNDDKAKRSRRMTLYTNDTDFPDVDQGTKWERYKTDSPFVWQYFQDTVTYHKFLETLALATDTKVSIEENALVNGNVYGGSKSGFVQRNTNVTINTTDTVNNVFGGGKGLRGFDNAGRVRGNDTVTINKGIITGNIYGGGELGFVGYFTVSDDGREYIWHKITDLNSDSITTGLCVVNITGGKVGPDNNSDKTKGNVYGAGKGEAITFKCEPALVRETNITIGNGTIINGNVYGGGEIGRVDQNTAIGISGGTINGDVFGAGAGIETHGYSALVRGNTNVTIEGSAQIKNNVYGGGEIASVGKYSLDANNMPVSLVSDSLGICSVTIQGNAIIGSGGASETAGHVFGAGKGIEPHFDNENGDKAKRSRRMTIYTNTTDFPALQEGTTWERYETGSPFVWQYYQDETTYRTYLETLALATQTHVTVGGTAHVNGDVYGGSENGFVQHHIYVTTQDGCEIGTSSSYGNIYGGGKGLDDFDAAGRVSGDITVSVNNGDNGTTHGSVYGGGKLGIVKGAVTVNINDGSVEKDVYGGGALAHTNTENWDGSTLSVKYHEVDGLTVGTDTVGGYYTKSGNIYTPATGKAVANTEYYRKTATLVNMTGGTVSGNIYGGGLGQKNGKNGATSDIEAIVYGDITVTTTGGTASNVFGANNFNGSPKGSVTVNIDNTATPAPSDTFAIDSVFGGGNLAKYEGSTFVNMNNGYVNYIFGGGNLADVTDSVTVTINGGNVVNDVYGGGALANTNTANWNTSTNTWADGMYDATKDTTKYKTFVNLNGGIIGNAYGGALGDSLHNNPAFVYGDVYVTVDGAALPIQIDTITISNSSEKEAIITKGRVFGGNNQLGTPKAKVTVLVTKTRNAKDNLKDKPKDGEFDKLHTRYDYYKRGDSCDVAAVFGGGNAADYEPVKNQAPNVIIDGCDSVSIRAVYGGGNAAAVPATNVSVDGAYLIEYVFGGGYGAGSNNHGANVGYKSFPMDTVDIDKNEYLYPSDGSGYEIGNAIVKIRGGYVDNVFGGSDTRGDIKGTTSTDISEISNGCDLRIGSLYGGGKKAAVFNDVTTFIYCPSNAVENVYGGAEEADIHGNVTLTIVAGKFTNVFGGNKKSGHIDKQITVNLEETEEGCRPIEIDNLYGGCDEAEYSGTDNGTGYNVIVNAKAFTRIGNLFGGSKGSELAPATLTGNTLVNINQTRGYWADSLINVAHIPADSIGIIGNVFGGGEKSKVVGNTYVNICTADSVEFITKPKHLWTIVDSVYNEITKLYKVPVMGAKITGDVYGGGKLANVTRNTYVNIGARPDNSSEGNYLAVAQGTEGLTIGGNVYGGGQGLADNYECDKAMVGIVDQGTGSTYVYIGNGTVGTLKNGILKDSTGNVYGGGMIGRVEADTHVTIGFGDDNTSISSPVILGSVFGAGQGVATHGYSGLVRGNSTVAVQGKTKIIGSVYGGGQKSSVGRFYVKDINDTDYEYKNNYDVPTGMPYAPISGGACSVTIKGYAEIGPDSMVMKNTKTGRPDDAGHVFGAGKGLIPYLDTDTEEGTGDGQGVGRYYKPDGVTYTWQSYNDNESAYLEYIETLALASFTDVTITGHAFIKGSVYGGSENGRVLDSTYVKIQENCQIGNGYVQMADDGTYLSKPLSMDRPYSKEEWTEGHLITTNDRRALQDLAATNYTSSLPECASWPYQAPYAAYDQYAIYQNSEGKYYYDADFTDTLYAEGGSVNGSDGHTFYGNVFGGGSGYYPYKNSDGQIKWHKEAGAVGGNTRVEVTGGHILTNLYGGNEMTNVGKGVADTEGGTCTIIFSDSATLGVPRTLGQIDHHPVTCYLFGAGKGDQRVFFNKQTNVNEVNITITGGWIYGSLFGGGEDGHVMRDVTITIDTTATTAPKIGTWGTSYVDGNVFGGGRGFAGDAYTAGNVGGSIDLKIKGGQMLGSIYGGGRLGSVGYGLYAVGERGYGEMRDDDKNDAGTQVNYFTHGRGHVNIEISGGTIGNDWEYDYIAPGENLATAKVNMPNTTHDANNKLLHTKGGNVYAGGMGRHDRLDGTPITQSETDIDWKKLGNVKSTKLTISGKARIKSNVYGGGEFGAVTGSHTGNDSKQWGTEIIITGGEIGTTIGTDDNQYQFGSVFGGGMGHNLYQGGDVKNNAFVSIQNATIRNSVYGGGEVGSVGTITNFATLDSIDEGGNYLYKHDDYKEEESAAHSEGAFYNFGLSWPYELLYDKTTGLASVTITGNTKIEGDVFGAAKGSVYVGPVDITQQRFIEAKIANVRETRITIGSASGTQPIISRSVYGGGEDGHVYENATIVINGGEIAHSVFGGGKGEGVYSDTLLDNTVDPEHWRLKADAELIHSWTAGKVYGNTYVTMNGGSVGYNLYGGGNLASVGKGNYAGGYDDYSIVGYGELPEKALGSKLWETSEGFDPDDPRTFTKLADYFMGSGRTYVNINSGTIGTATGYEEDENHNKFPYGNVFGSSRGKAALNVGQLSPRYRYTPDFFLGYTNETYVTIGNDTVLDAPRIYGSVYGGGQDGHVRRHTNVIINKGEIGVQYSSTDVVIKDRGNVYGAGSGMGQYDTGKKDAGNNPILAYNNSSGSVTCTTNITIKDGIIHQNVYGGGAMASVGPPNAGQLFDEYNDTTSYTIPYIPGVTSTHANVEKHASVSYTEVNIKGGQIGSSTDFSNNNYGGNVYGASRGGDYAAAILKYNEDPNTYTTVLWPTVNVAGGAIAGNVFGGGEMGMVKCGVSVNITGGAIGNDVYGGGALAHTNTSNWDYTRAGVVNNVWKTGSWGKDWAKGKITLSGKRTTTYNTKVNILGGTIGSATSGGDVYGGGLGQLGDDPVEAIVYGDVFVNLNGLDKNDFKNNQIPDSLSRIVPPAPGSEHEYRIATNAKGAIVNRIFGANNLNGSPRGHIKVHVFATQNRDANKDSIHAKYAKHPIQGEEGHEDETLSQYLHRIDTTYTTLKATPAVRSAIEAAVSANNTYNTTQNDENKTALDNAIALMDTALFKLYDVQAVYGGGNLAEYVWCKRDTIINKNQTELVDAARTEVIIDGCDYSSIRQVYGGGNAASAPGTFVEVNGSYEIYELFGGGNGADDYELDGVWYDNPGANVGYHNYTYVVKIGEESYNASTHGTGSVNTPYLAIDNDDADTPENRRAHYAYGSGIATTNIRGGTIHYVFGGSNKKGNISTTALSVYSESDDDCPIDIHETYGGGKDAPIDGDIDLTLDCVKDMDMIFGGSKNADVNSNITLNITNGRFNKVFGGNNTSGAISGSITVNVEESGCVPIEINELYGGGYLAPYSIYGYEKDGYGNYVTKYVQYLDNDNNVDSLKQRIPLTSGATHKNNPRINIISATRIGTVYGGGYQAKVVGSPYVNVNMTNGKVEVKGTVISGDTIYKDGHDTIYAAVIADTIRESGSDVIKEIKHYAPLEIGTIDTIYGGGNLASIIGDTHVEIGTGRWVTSWDSNGNPIYETVDVNGNKYIYKVDTLAVTYSNEECAANNDTIPGAISESTVLTAEQATRLNELLSTSYSAGSSPILADAKKYNETLDGYITTADVKKPAVWAWYDKDTVKLDVQAQPTPARYAANITGDVFGGGKGKADNFTCDKAMIGDAVDLPNPAERNGGTNVIIANGTVGGSVYGGGMIARVEKNTAVTIGFESGIGEPIIGKDVFGAGMGAPTHGYAGLVRGNSSVIIQGNSKVKGSVYGGGMQASLGRYFIATSQALATLHKVRVGMPYDLKNGGKATVIVRGNAEIGPDTLLMTAPGGPQNTGHVFGAGKGTRPYESDSIGRYFIDVTDGNKYKWQSYKNDEDAYIEYIETLGITNETEVTIGGNAFIKGSVYGGSESGFVLKNTHVTIQDNCQIGNGLVQMADDGTYLDNPLNMNRPYSAQEWAEGHLIMTAADSLNVNLTSLVGSNYSSSLPECSSWPYEAPYAPYDKFADANGRYPENSVDTTARGGRPTGSDGHTFYGNVFGGGSGYDPYKPGKWHYKAGSVGGNTVVDITGGHILTSVYGGNEMTNVDSTATINMTGGTLGVPRTLGQIAAHPVTCYLFGAGKGDMRTFFNTETNVAKAIINISDSARIYGSVFGGGEDGHVLGDVTLNILAGDSIMVGDKKIQHPYIGTTGTSYVDGNVFGAGRGFNGEAITAGSVGGNVVTNITGGTILGSVYGGGRLASVGIGFNAPTDSKYGQFTEDTISKGKTYGHITVNISGGTIGNDLENQFFAVQVETDGKTSQEVENLKNAGLKAKKNSNRIPNTDFELYDSVLVGNSSTKYNYLYRTIHTKGGNVYGGSMGRLTLLDNSFNPMWPQLGQVKSVTVNITGGTIKSNVYGGGEMGSVRDSTCVTISGSPTIYRDVYGGGYGSSIDSEESKAIVESLSGSNTIRFGYSPLQWAGIVGIKTELNIDGGWIKKSVYGGGEMASVGIINYILDDTEFANESDVPADKVIFRKNPKSNKYTVYANVVKHYDEANSFALSWPYELEYVSLPDGSSYFGTSQVNIKGGRIGITGKDFMGPFNPAGYPLDVITDTILDESSKAYKDARMDNGDVFGGGKGLAGDRYEMAFLANVGSTEVTIDYPSSNKADQESYKKDKNNDGLYDYDCITGSVYAGAENGHVMGNTQLTLNNGLVGHALYGGGKGKGTYSQKIVKIGSVPDENDPTTYPDSAYTNVNIYSITAGKVYGNTKVDMSGGIVVRNVYGGGNMGSVGKGNYAGGTDDYSYYHDVEKNTTHNGYGEAINANLWQSTNEGDDAWQFLNSGKTEVNITGGTIGYIKKTDAEDSMKDGLPYGNVFGGCRGESAPNITESPRYHYSPQFFSGYTNETKVTIGEKGATTGPTILGSVYGGGQDGHVRRDATVIINSGEIGKAYVTEGTEALKDKDGVSITDQNNPVWLHRGNVYGAGSGIGKYQYDFNYNNQTATDDGEIEEATYKGKTIKEEDYSTSAGSVTRFTKVEINGGTIHRNVYGGGSLASVGAPKIPPTRTDDNPYYKGDSIANHGEGKQSLNEVIINGGTIGDTISRAIGYGGNIYGASRGLSELGSQFATSVWTKVEANTGHIYGNIFGGGEAGSVTMDTKVIIGGKVPETPGGAPRRAAPAAVQPNAAAPAGNAGNAGNSSPSTPANVSTEAPDARSIRVNRANQ